MANYQGAGNFSVTIDELSSRSCKNDSYPRPDLVSLSTYLNTDRPYSSAIDSHNLGHFPQAEIDRVNAIFVVVHDIITGSNDEYEASPTGMERFIARSCESPQASLIFLRGFPSPQWLTAVGDMHGVTTELYRRHLDFQAFTSGWRKLYLSPRLPSSSAHVFQLAIPTIYSINVDNTSRNEPEDLQIERRLGAKEMARYFSHLRSDARVADSVVRGYQLISREEYILEQYITVEVGRAPVEHGSWRTIVWMDSGRDLSKSVTGPWRPKPGTLASWENYFLPIIVDRAIDQAVPNANGQQREAAEAAEAAYPAIRTSSAEAGWSADQNICMLPFQYGSCLDRSLASRDSLYALSELFRFSASATSQVLNFIHSKIEQELSLVGAHDVLVNHHYTTSMRNLNYIKALLVSHTRGLVEVVGIFRNRNSLPWPRVVYDNGQDYAVAEQTATVLLADFEHLLLRAETLSQECNQGILTLTNSAALEESRRTTEMSMTVQRLTTIGTVFIPLSFVCSVWGMNFRELGSGSLSVWTWPVLAAPIILFSYVLYNWENICRRISYVIKA